MSGHTSTFSAKSEFSIPSCVTHILELLLLQLLQHYRSEIKLFIFVSKQTKFFWQQEELFHEL